MSGSSPAHPQPPRSTPPHLSNNLIRGAQRRTRIASPIASTEGPLMIPKRSAVALGSRHSQGMISRRLTPLLRSIDVT
jgi:hypothetical protein